VKPKTLSILSFNILGMPLLSRKYAPRLKKIVEEIARIDPDVVCLQEVWLGATKKYLVRQLAAVGFGHFYRPMAGWRLSGLLVLTKPKIFAPQKYFFAPSVENFSLPLTELLVASGYCWFELSVGGQKMIIVDLHLSVDWQFNLASAQGLGLGRLAELSRLAKEIKNLGKRKIIVAGDFNLEKNSSVYRKFLQISGLDDPGRGSIFKTTLFNLYRWPMAKSGQQRDFIFTKNLDLSKIKVQLLWVQPFPQIGCLSDHAGLLMALKL